MSVSMSKKMRRIMIVDDSVVVRGMLRQIIEAEADLEIVTTAINGKVALTQYKNHRPDVVLMDIEMPEMDGIECLSEILKFDPEARVIMCSSLTQKGAKLSIKALGMGAIECLAKPTTTSIDKGDEFKSRLLTVLRQLNTQAVKIKPQKPLPSLEKTQITLRDFPQEFLGSVPQVMAIGSSTGGPAALTEILKNIPKDFDIPILITQHMPVGFTKILADTLTNQSGHEVIEAQDDMPVQKNKIYLAPGGRHMGVVKASTGVKISLSDDAPIQFCKPAVDYMLGSILNHYHQGIITVILTGMGEDGLEGARHVVEASKKNILIAQDETTSIVWGMPAAVANAQLCHFVIPMSNIAPALNKLMRGQKPL